MGFDMGTVEAKLLGHRARRGDLGEDPLPDPTARPARIPIVDRFGGTVFRRNVSPTAPGLQNMQDARDHSTIIDPRLARLVLRQMRIENRPRLVRQPEQIAHDPLHRQNSMPDRISQMCQLFDWVPKVGPAPVASRPAINGSAVLAQERAGTIPGARKPPGQW